MSYKRIEEIVIKPLQVEVINGNFEEAFKRFKSLVQKEKIITQYKERMAYEKPSQKKRRKSRQALERKLLAESREQLILSGEWDRRQKKKEIRRRQRQEEHRRQEGVESNHD
jgi:small subunit ribosomal protein S21